MALGFEDHAGFEKAAAQAAMAGAAAGFAAGALGGTELFAAHALLAGRAQRALELLLAGGGAAAVLAWGGRRRRALRAAGEPLASRWLVAAGALLAALGGVLAARALPPLGLRLVELLEGLALTAWMPGALLAALALALCGAAFGLWVACASLPARLSPAGRVEERLAALRAELAGEPRALAERAAAACREALKALAGRGEGAPPLRGPLEELALLALELAGRAARLGRSATAAQDEAIGRRRAELEALAAAATDPAARASLERAAQAQAQLAGRCAELRGARERLVARLHAEVAELERARLSIALLEGADAERAANELDLLGARLRSAGSAAEATAGLAEEEAGRAPAALVAVR